MQRLCWLIQFNPVSFLFSLRNTETSHSFLSLFPQNFTQKDFLVFLQGAAHPHSASEEPQSCWSSTWQVHICLNKADLQIQQMRSCIC